MLHYTGASLHPAILQACTLLQEAPSTVSVDYHARTGINSRAEYEELYNRSIQDPAGFWADFAGQFHWEKPVRPYPDHSHASLPLLALFRALCTL